MISFIVAMDKNNVIGYHNQLPWQLPADLAYFKKVTTGHPIIMGRKTFESIGRPLPGRRNIVITRDTSYYMEGIEIVHSIEDAVRLIGEDEAFIIGGANIFEQAFKFAQKLYITYIHEEFVGDTYFNEFKINEWKLESSINGIKDEKNPYEYEFVVYNRK